MKSFKTCAISNAIDGSEDDQILCLRDKEHSAICRQDVAELTQELIENRGNYYSLNLSDRPLLIDTIPNAGANNNMNVNEGNLSIDEDEDEDDIVL